MLRVPYGEDRARCFSDDFFGHATHHQMRRKAMTMRSHDDQVDLALTGIADDLDIWAPSPARSQNVLSVEIILFLFCQGLPEQRPRGVLPTLRGAHFVELLPDDELPLDHDLEIVARLDVEQMQLGRKRSCQSDPVFRC
jgi:hypothetical protein